MELQLAQSQGLPSLTDKQNQIGMVIYHVNQLINYPIPDDRISEWSRSIDEILPDLSIEDLKEVIRDFKIGELEYDRYQGIQNIFMGLKANFGGKYISKKY